MGSGVQTQIELRDDYSRYKFEYEEIRTRLRIEGILENRKGAGALERQVTNKRPERQRERRKQTYLVHEKKKKKENMSPLTGKDVENPMGLFSTELKVYKVRGVKTTSRR